MNIKSLILVGFMLLIYSKALLGQENTSKYPNLQDFFKIDKDNWCYAFYPKNYLTNSLKIKSALDYINDSTNIYSYSMMAQIEAHHYNVYLSINDSIKIMQYYAYLKYCRCSDSWTWFTLKEQIDYKTAKSIIILGKKALKPLMILLQDKRITMACRSTEGTAFSNHYIPRIRDFAYRYAALILGEQPIFLKTPEERDVIIDAFIKKYPKYFGNN